jgi:hypothetical protein
MNVMALAWVAMTEMPMVAQPNVLVALQVGIQVAMPRVRQMP